jgi:hypothetical protein
MARLQSLRSSRQRKSAKRKIWKTTIAFVVALASTCSTVVFFFNSHFFRISDISVQGDGAVLNMQIRSIIGKSISGDFFWFIPKDSLFFFPSKTLTKSIEAQFPLIASISFSHKGLTGMQAMIKERSKYAVVCLGSGIEDCYYADENGIIFETASSTTGALLLYHISLPDNASPIGIDFLDGGRLQAVSAFVGGLSRLGFADKDIAVSTDNDYDFSLEYAKNSPPLHLVINESRPFLETLQDFSAFWQEYTASSTKSGNTGAPILSSVDMRYGDNIIYKTK